jgi:hypothetical protein
MPFLLLCSALVLAAAASAPPAGAQKVTEEQYTLSIDYSADETLEPVVAQLRDHFVQCYPRLVKRFENPDRPAPRKVLLEFRKGINNPAFASGNKLTFSVEWFKRHPDDLGVLAHELTHIVQGYRRGAPGWLTEGIADYARYVYGPVPDGDWKLPARLVEGRHKYTDAYRVTARFLAWVEETRPGTVDALNRRLQADQYQPPDWEKITGKSVDALWAECLASFQ